MRSDNQSSAACPPVTASTRYLRIGLACKAHLNAFIPNMTTNENGSFLITCGWSYRISCASPPLNHPRELRLIGQHCGCRFVLEYNIPKVIGLGQPPQNKVAAFRNKPNRWNLTPLRRGNFGCKIGLQAIHDCLDLLSEIAWLNRSCWGRSSVVDLIYNCGIAPDTRSVYKACDRFHRAAASGHHFYPEPHPPLCSLCSRASHTRVSGHLYGLHGFTAGKHHSIAESLIPLGTFSSWQTLVGWSTTCPQRKCMVARTLTPGTPDARWHSNNTTPVPTTTSSASQTP